MDNIHILCISDIHFGKYNPENQALVLNEFFADVSQKMQSYDMSCRYCIIAGDLVNIGNTKQSYEKFYNIFIKRLTKIIPIEHIICTPGNHDLNRDEISKSADEHNRLVSYKGGTESEFNTDIKTENSLA